jgi:outer membrane protein assembly factor BamE (lipoprotein component of BamABCDE complex)
MSGLQAKSCAGRVFNVTFESRDFVPGAEFIMRTSKTSIAGFSRASVAKLAFAALLSLSLGGCLGYDGELQHGYVADERLLEQVKVGSSAEQVLVVLGTPSTTSTIGGSAWYYISQRATQTLAFQQPNIVERRIFSVYFDKNKKVERIANYGLQDGQVFDFVSRTTPTAGAESSFISNAMKNLLRF